MLALADYLESATLEASCMGHLANESSFPLKQQFQMAETYNSEKLMIQVCASIKDAYQLDEVVPEDLNSFCNTTKNIVMQRSFELLGIRRPPSPPLLENPDQVFERMINQIVDQVEVQHHHGEVLKDQVDLLFDHMITESHLGRRDKPGKEIICADPLIKELSDQLRNAGEQSERNFIQAQIQVLTFKHIYTRVRNEELGFHPTLCDFIIRDVPVKLRALSAILNSNERSQSRSHKVTLGNREIDEIYRTITTEAIRNNQVEPLRNANESAVWLQGIDELNNTFKTFADFTQHRTKRPRPHNQREVSNRASFRVINELIRNARDFYYTVPEENGQH
ncbi:hypothetical protein CAEBREN_18621 [Caenorhabditis brenneri]|uniref:Uncharacterized protein n=1 Tax=Caenorhabditis brenneri TaxID=135651 RepID=G0NE08_CAEBE|nr:hypothetical protein CAEBREN_18621 [Caenorhabditis brenneri]